MGWHQIQQYLAPPYLAAPPHYMSQQPLYVVGGPMLPPDVRASYVIGRAGRAIFGRGMHGAVVPEEEMDAILSPPHTRGTHYSTANSDSVDVVAVWGRSFHVALHSPSLLVPSAFLFLPWACLGRISACIVNCGLLCVFAWQFGWKACVWPSRRKPVCVFFANSCRCCIFAIIVLPLLLGGRRCRCRSV